MRVSALGSHRATRLAGACAALAAAAAVLAPAASAKPGGSSKTSGSHGNSPAISFSASSPAAGATLWTGSAAFTFIENRTAKQIQSLTCALSGPVPSASAQCQAPVTSAKSSSSGVSYSGLTDGNYTLTITLTLTDGGTTTVTRDFTVEIPIPPVYQVSIEAVTTSTDAKGNTTYPNQLIFPDFTDPSGHLLTETVTGQPAYGTVTNNGDGTFTYTPNAAAQNAVAYYDLAKAAAAIGVSITVPNPAPPTSDSFTITADDGHGGITSQVVTVPIMPYYPVTSTANSASVTFAGSGYLVPGVGLTLGDYSVITSSQLIITTAQLANLDTSFQFSADPNDYLITGPVPLNIGSCATDPTNQTCATPPPPSSPTSTQQIPPLPIEDFYGGQTANTWLTNEISTGVATLATTYTIGGVAAAAKIAADAAEAAALFLAW